MGSIFVLAEASADHHMVKCLADRVLLESAPDDAVREQGLASPWLNTIRDWCGIESGTAFTAWKNIKRLAQQHGVARVLGARGDRHLDRDMFRKALLVAEKLRQGRQRWMIVSRDLDTQDPASRRKSLEDIHEEYQAKGWLIVLAMALPFREAWVLNGFNPANPKERQTFADEKNHLGFDPTLNPERLTAQADEAKKNAKRVLKVLLQHSRDIRGREQECLEEATLDQLRERGTGSGLSAYLDAIEQHLVPRILGQV